MDIATIRELGQIIDSLSQQGLAGFILYLVLDLVETLASLGALVWIALGVASRVRDGFLESGAASDD